VPSPYPQLNDPEWLRTEYLERGRTGDDIAAEVGCPPKTLFRALARHDIRRPPHSMATVPKRWLRDQHVRRGRSTRDIAAEIGVSPRSVQRALAEAGIPVNDRRLPPELDDPEWLHDHRHLDRKSLADLLGCSVEAVTRARRRHGLRGGTRSPFWQLDDPDWLRARYHGDGWSQQRIPDDIGCSRVAVGQAMQRLGIPARPPQQGWYPQLQDPAWLAEQVRAGRSGVAIARELGCHPTSVAAALRRFGL
jgi:AraC-like DNA-binding protein